MCAACVCVWLGAWVCSSSGCCAQFYLPCLLCNFNTLGIMRAAKVGAFHARACDLAHGIYLAVCGLIGV